MIRTVQTQFKDVSPTPSSLRSDPRIDQPVTETSINLGQLFQHYYFDSYGRSAPSINPSRFEYLELVSAQPNFSFHGHIRKASQVKRRGLITELGQAFCRWMLHEHFGIYYFAHLEDVIGKSTHAAFDGLCISRATSGDIPDYLCATNVSRPMLAEAKGRSSSIGFHMAMFQTWREQFTRIRVSNRRRGNISLKGYIVATSFVTDQQPTSRRTTVFTEDPETAGEPPDERSLSALGRGVTSLHYARVLRKLDLLAPAASLDNGFTLAEELRFRMQVWECLVPPLKGIRFVGGFYVTDGGSFPEWRDGAWSISPALGRAHAVFVGLKLGVAQGVMRAARGDWNRLSDLPQLEPEGIWSSEVSWLRDGTVMAPLEYFVPVGLEVM